MVAPDGVPLFLTDGFKEYTTALLTHFGQWMQPPGYRPSTAAKCCCMGCHRGHSPKRCRGEVRRVIVEERWRSRSAGEPIGLHEVRAPRLVSSWLPGA